MNKETDLRKMLTKRKTIRKKGEIEKRIDFSGIKSELMKKKEWMPDSLINHLPGMAFRRLNDSKCTMLFVSKGCFSLTGYKPSDFINNKKSYADIVYLSDRKVCCSIIKKALKNKSAYEIEYKINTKNRKTKWVLEKGKGVYLKTGKLLFLDGLIIDITKQKENESEQAQSKENYKNLVEFSPDGIFIHDKKGAVVFANKRALNIIGEKSINVLNNKTIFHYILPEYHDRVRKTRALLENGEKPDFITTKLRRADGKVIEVESKQINCIFEGEECVLVVYHDVSYLRRLEGEVFKAQTTEKINVSLQREISERKKAEEKMNSSLKEKEALLKELHHRVKNNLQVISSILNLQSSYVKDADTLNLLRESQNRIKSMAFIHESLYQTKDFANINFSDYINNLTINLLHSYSNSETEVVMKLAIQKIFINMDTAIPCGLIINELVSNSLKYAFNGKQSGEIRVAMKEGKESYELEVRDNGMGLPPAIDYRNTDSLGLQLVVTLVEQINGKLELKNKKGTAYYIWIPKVN